MFKNIFKIKITSTSNDNNDISVGKKSNLISNV